MPFRPYVSLGSRLHGRAGEDGKALCVPCAWFHKAGGCQTGSACRFCHLCTEDDLAARKQQKWERHQKARQLRKERAERQERAERNDESKENLFSDSDMGDLPGEQMTVWPDTASEDESSSLSTYTAGSRSLAGSMPGSMGSVVCYPLTFQNLMHTTSSAEITTRAGSSKSSVCSRNLDVGDIADLGAEADLEPEDFCEEAGDSNFCNEPGSGGSADWDSNETKVPSSDSAEEPVPEAEQDEGIPDRIPAVSGPGRVSARMQAALCDGRLTTLMVRNLPRDTSQEQFRAELETSGFAGLYDFCYMPTRSFKTRGSAGFAFVNFVSVQAAEAFARSWHHTRRLGARPGSRLLDVSPATIQGQQANAAKAGSKRMGRIKNNRFRPTVLTLNGAGEEPLAPGAEMPPNAGQEDLQQDDCSGQASNGHKVAAAPPGHWLRHCNGWAQSGPAGEHSGPCRAGMDEDAAHAPSRANGQGQHRLPNTSQPPLGEQMGWRGHPDMHGQQQAAGKGASDQGASVNSPGLAGGCLPWGGIVPECNGQLSCPEKRPMCIPASPGAQPFGMAAPMIPMAPMGMGMAPASGGWALVAPVPVIPMRAPMETPVPERSGPSHMPTSQRMMTHPVRRSPTGEPTSCFMTPTNNPGVPMRTPSQNDMEYFHEYYSQSGVRLPENGALSWADISEVTHGEAPPCPWSRK